MCTPLWYPTVCTNVFLGHREKIILLWSSEFLHWIHRLWTRPETNWNKDKRLFFLFCLFILVTSTWKARSNLDTHKHVVTSIWKVTRLIRNAHIIIQGALFERMNWMSSLPLPRKGKILNDHNETQVIFSHYRTEKFIIWAGLFLFGT